MAGDWIKMRLDLQTHPKVVRILSAMRPNDVQTVTDKFRVVGGLHAVWSVFDTHSADGRLNGYSAETLDHIIGWPGFSSAMIGVDWLAEDAQALVLPEFCEHNGKSGKRRAEDQKRKRDDRKSPQLVRNLSANDADENGTREEKRREDKESSGNSRGTRLPTDWHPSAEDAAFCKAERLDLKPSEVAKRFYDYWIAQPGVKGRKADWSATWRNWVRAEKPGLAPVAPKVKDWE